MKCCTGRRGLLRGQCNSRGWHHRRSFALAAPNSLAAETVPYEVALSLCLVQKRADPANWAPGDKTGAVCTAFGVVCDPPRPGLVVEIAINRGAKARRRTVNFGLWDTSTGGYVRVYQLTIADSASPTHSENGKVWFGSHEHMGDRATHRPDLDAVPFGSALTNFLGTISLAIESPIEDPLDPETFQLR